MAAPTRRTTAYNTAYLHANRSHLIAAHDLDPAAASGHVDEAFEELVPPGDHERRRRAVLEFYGHRCGRCTRDLAAAEPADDEYLGYAFSVGRVRGAEEPWALEELVALCEPCFDLVDAADEAAVGRVATRFRQAPQFPSWHCDPRVAIERAPLSGRELFRRERLAADVEPTFDFRVNDAVAEHAALALSTPASRAVAMGERLLAARAAAPGEPNVDAGVDANPGTGSLPVTAGPTDAPASATTGTGSDLECPERAWAAAPPRVHVDYDRRVLQPREIAAGDRWVRPAQDVADDGPLGPEAPASATATPPSEG